MRCAPRTIVQYATRAAAGTTGEMWRMVWAPDRCAPWCQGLRAMMVLLSQHGLPADEIAALLECHPSTVWRWIGRFSWYSLPRRVRPA